MPAIRFQGCGVDLPPRPVRVLREGFLQHDRHEEDDDAGKPECRGRAGPQPADGVGEEVEGHDRQEGRDDHCPDRLRPSMAEGVALVGRARGDVEPQDHDHRGEGVREGVPCIGHHGNRPEPRACPVLDAEQERVQDDRCPSFDVAQSARSAVHRRFTDSRPLPPGCQFKCESEAAGPRLAESRAGTGRRNTLWSSHERTRHRTRPAPHRRAE